MATTEASSQPSMAFHKFPDLPKDLRLMIIEKVVQVVGQPPSQASADQDPWAVQVVNPGKRTLLPALAKFNREWNRFIEMRLFKSIKITPSDLAEFDAYCSRRQGRLNTVKLSISNQDIVGDVQPEVFVGSAISRLLNIMQHWDSLDRDRQGLIQVQLDVSNVWIRSELGFNVSSGFGTLHNTPVVEALYEVNNWGGLPVLHPSSALAIYRALPNVRRVGLNLRRLDDEQASLAQATNDIAMLGTIRPNLTHLELLADSHWPLSFGTWKFWAPATDCIASFPQSWYNTLVRLDLKQVIDLPASLTEAGRVAWPHLKTLVLLGEVDSKDSSDQQLRVMNTQTSTALFRALTTMLPNTPKLTTVLVEMHDFSWNWDSGSFRLQMCIGIMAEGVETSFGQPCSFASCSYNFVPTLDMGTMVVSGTRVSGDATTELQRAVRAHQRKDLVVFSHNFDTSPWGRGQCLQWDPEESIWVRVFENEADELIYRMGQYLDSI